LVTRRFASFAEAAEEAGVSRVYGGIHFPFDNTAGQALGRAVGEAIVNSQL
jgi:membrane-associated phospholipid phosphatase